MFKHFGSKIPIRPKDIGIKSIVAYQNNYDDSFDSHVVSSNINNMIDEKHVIQ